MTFISFYDIECLALKFSDISTNVVGDSWSIVCYAEGGVQLYRTEELFVIFSSPGVCDLCVTAVVLKVWSMTTWWY